MEWRSSCDDGSEAETMSIASLEPLDEEGERSCYDLSLSHAGARRVVCVCGVWRGLCMPAQLAI